MALPAENKEALAQVTVHFSTDRFQRRVELCLRAFKRVAADDSEFRAVEQAFQNVIAASKSLQQKLNDADILSARNTIHGSHATFSAVFDRLFETHGSSAFPRGVELLGEMVSVLPFFVRVADGEPPGSTPGGGLYNAI